MPRGALGSANLAFVGTADLDDRREARVVLPLIGAAHSGGVAALVAGGAGAAAGERVVEAAGVTEAGREARRGAGVVRVGHARRRLTGSVGARQSVAARRAGVAGCVLGLAAAAGSADAAFVSAAGLDDRREARLVLLQVAAGHSGGVAALVAGAAAAAAGRVVETAGVTEALREARRDADG